LSFEVWEDPRKRRDRFQIIEGILKTASNGAYKTQIMYGTGLSFRQLTAYLSFLIKIGLLEATEKDEKHIYKTTIKGMQYLEDYKEIGRLLRKSAENRVVSLRSP
jgi:predicted transcriptional regulator